jgi:hypothetical protein
LVVGCIFGKINLEAGWATGCLKHRVKHRIMVLEVLLARQACAFPIYARFSLLNHILCFKKDFIF